MKYSLVLLEKYVCYDQGILFSKLLLALALLIQYSKAKFAGYSRYFFTSYFAFQFPIMKRISLGVLVPEGLVDLHRTIQLQPLQPINRKLD